MSALPDHPDIEKLPDVLEGIPVKESIRQLFRDPVNGIPDNISKEGCLALALKSNELGGAGKGYVVWNTWRRAFPVPHLSIVNHANFQESEFTEVMDFRLFEFGYAANFQKTIFRKEANFDHAKFGTSTDFGFSYWADGASFRWTQCEADIKFNNSYWCNHANFLGAQFVSANFHLSYFKNGACFIGAGWSDYVIFSSCFFNHLSCEAAEWHYLKTRFYDSILLFDELKNYANKIGSNPTVFEGLFFTGSQFEGGVDFSNRKFSKTSLFNQTENVNDILRNGIGIPLKDVMGNIQHVEHIGIHPVFFRVAPKFFGCELHQDTSFEGAEFPKPTGSNDKEAARSYRTLKLAFSKQQAIREEQRFFRLEMAEETMGYRNKTKQALRQFEPLTGLREGFTWILYKAYSVLSDYGFSVARPLVLLVAAWLVFAAIYGSHLNGQTICIVWQAGCELQVNWLNFSLQQALPLPGFDKLDHPIKGVAVGWLFLHKTISLAALFLIGLALRNLFKLK